MPPLDHTILSKYNPLTQVTNANIKSSPGTVFSCLITNANAAVRYLQLFNKTAAPSAGNAPDIICVPVPGGTANNPGNIFLDATFFSHAGFKFATGLSWAISTTFATFTDSATASEHIILLTYI